MRTTITSLVRLAVGACTLSAFTAMAQSADTRITVTHEGYSLGGQPIPAGIFLECRGAPTCTSETQSTTPSTLPECPGNFSSTVRTTMTGVNLSATSLSGTIAVGVTFTASCTEPTTIDLNYTYSGTFSPTTRSGSITIHGPTCTHMGVDACAGLTSTIPATIKADPVPAPVFPMTVTSNITPATATASAQIQFRPQDVGTSGSVFVFAVAPAGVVRGGRDPDATIVGFSRGDEKSDRKADACVISQLNAAGQLVAVSAQQLSAYLSGVLSSQGASVSILGGIPTPNVAGATFYVGYGSGGQRMIDTGIFRNAVLVPGGDVCPTLPSQTSLWWNPSESGWGLNLNQQGATIFATLFTYDASRAPRWYVMSGGRMGTDGVTYTGDLYRTTGPAFNANPFTPIGAANVTRVGTMTLTFNEANVATLRYTVDGVQVVKTVQRQVYGSRAANCLPTNDSRASSTNYQDLWWNPNESGWGVNITHQDNTLFATLFTYDSAGRDVWLVLSAGARQADGSYSGELYRTSGPTFNSAPFTGVTAAPVGTMRLAFSNGNSGTLTYTFNGATVTKSIQRQLFGSPASLCN